MRITWSLIWLAKGLRCIIWWEKTNVLMSIILSLSQIDSFATKERLRVPTTSTSLSWVIAIKFQFVALDGAKLYYVKVQEKKNKTKESLPQEIYIWKTLPTTFWLGHLGIKDHELLYSRSFEMNMQQPIGDQVFMLDGWFEPIGNHNIVFEF